MRFDPPNPFNIADCFLDDRVREGKGHRVALRTGDGDVTYAALQARANRFANALTAMGVRPEERVLIALPDVPDFAAALFGTLKLGAVGVMVNPFLDDRRVRDICDYARAAAVVLHADQGKVFARAAAAAGSSPAAARQPDAGPASGQRNG